MSSKEIQRALRESGLTIPAGGGLPSQISDTDDCRWGCKEACLRSCAQSEQSAGTPEPVPDEGSGTG